MVSHLILENRGGEGRGGGRRRFWWDLTVIAIIHAIKTNKLIYGGALTIFYGVLRRLRSDKSGTKMRRGKISYCPTPVSAPAVHLLHVLCVYRLGIQPAAVVTKKFANLETCVEIGNQQHMHLYDAINQAY